MRRLRLKSNSSKYDDDDTNNNNSNKNNDDRDYQNTPNGYIPSTKRLGHHHEFDNGSSLSGSQLSLGSSVTNLLKDKSELYENNLSKTDLNNNHNDDLQSLLKLKQTGFYTLHGQLTTLQNTQGQGIYLYSINIFLVFFFHN